MGFLEYSFIALAILYGLELYFLRKTRLFGAFFWLFVVQVGILFGGDMLLRYQIGQSLPGWIKSLGMIPALFTFSTIGIMPVAALLAALVVGAVIAAKAIWKKVKQISN
jgi:hypothetical protein